MIDIQAVITEKILPAAVQAPSAHNTQPWLFSTTIDTLSVYADWSRHLTISDPTERELYVSLGCSIMNAQVAAAHSGLQAEVSYFPEGGADRRRRLASSFAKAR